MKNKIIYAIDDHWYKCYYNGREQFVKTPTDMPHVQVMGYSTKYHNVTEVIYVPFSRTFDSSVKNAMGYFGAYIPDWTIPKESIKKAQRKIYRKIRTREKILDNF